MTGNRIKVSGFGTPKEPEAEKPEKEQKKEDSKLLQVMDTFTDTYSPVESLEESTDLLSSQEIVDLFSSVIQINKDMLFEQLKTRGFVIKTVDGRFLWLLKEKTRSM